MLRVRTGPAPAFLCVLALLTALAATGGLSAAGWWVGVGCGAGTSLALAHGRARWGADRLRPADRVTLARVVLACGVAALTAEALAGSAAVATLVGLSSAGLMLDFVDGRVARRTHASSKFGARFDMEADAFLILVLSVYVGHTTGWWVLAIGLARYLFGAAGSVLPWLRGPVPPRWWAKVVAAFQGVALTVAAAAVLPDPATTVMLVIALLLLAESFGHQIWQLWSAKAHPGDSAAEVATSELVGNG